jgi:patatin-like phospholipase/acyl hydrolase
MAQALNPPPGAGDVAANDDLDTTGLCLLSLDGGGVRGLSSLYILKGLMTRLNYERDAVGLDHVKPCEIFDLIGGTSTGGCV